MNGSPLTSRKATNSNGSGAHWCLQTYLLGSTWILNHRWNSFSQISWIGHVGPFQMSCKGPVLKNREPWQLDTNCVGHSKQVSPNIELVEKIVKSSGICRSPCKLIESVDISTSLTRITYPSYHGPGGSVRQWSVSTKSSEAANSVCGQSKIAHTIQYYVGQLYFAHLGALNT